METTQQQPEEEGKTGVIPNEQLAGSDADKAYDQDGNFQKPTPAEGTEPGASSKGMGGSDTRGEDSAADPNQSSLPTDGPDDGQEDNGQEDDDDQGHVET
jgi:hypothetical protein